MVALILVSCAQTARADDAHEVEIKIFASTMAVVRTVGEECPGFRANDRDLEALRLSLHVEEADHPAFAEQARAAVRVLHQGLADAPSRQAWCDAVYRLYGPDGTLISGIISR